MSPRLAFAVETARRAGRLTLAHFHTDLEVEFKADRSPVTVADRAAERLIREAIEAEFPGEAILGEEEGETGARGESGQTSMPGEQKLTPCAQPIGSASPKWVVDPIDGTKSFVAGVPLFATLLSYEEKGRAELGVCYFPALDLMLSAERGHGSTANGRPCRVSLRKTVDGSILCCGGHASMARYGRMEPFLRLAARAMTTRTWCDAYGHALVAMGQADAMIDPIVQRYDVSAMSAIVEEAGGRFTNFQGEAGLHSEAISSNGAIHDEIVREFST